MLQRQLGTRACRDAVPLSEALSQPCLKQVTCLPDYVGQYVSSCLSHRGSAIYPLRGTEGPFIIFKSWWLFSYR